MLPSGERHPAAPRRPEPSGNTLNAAAGAAADADQVWREYRLHAFAGVLMAVIVSTNVERTSRGDEMFAVMTERPARQAMQMDSLSLL